MQPAGRRLKNFLYCHQLHTLKIFLRAPKAFRRSAGRTPYVLPNGKVSVILTVGKPDLLGFGAEDADRWSSHRDADVHRAAIIRDKDPALREDGRELPDRQHGQNPYSAITPSGKELLQRFVFGPEAEDDLGV